MSLVRHGHAAVPLTGIRVVELAGLGPGPRCMRYPVLSFSEVAQFPQIAARQSLTTINGTLQAAPAPRFSGSDPVGPTVPPTRSTSFDDLLREWLNLDPNC